MADRAVRLDRIRRPSRLEAVWLSYWTRWQLMTVALVTGFVCAICASGVWISNSRQSLSAVPSAPEPVPAATIVPNQPDRKIDWNKLRSLSLSNLDSCKQLWTPGAIPRLESLTVFAKISDHQLAEICRRYDLKSLTLYDVGGLSAAGFSVLGSETHLEYLRLLSSWPVLGASSQQHDGPKLVWPPNLRTLDCDDTGGIPLQRLKEWQQLPHLECLSTRLVLLENHHPAEAIEALRGFPSLKRLFILEMGKNFPGVDSVQAMLPELRVRPTHFDPARGRRVTTVLIGGMLVVLFLSIQLSSQFMTTCSLLTPRFVRSHLGPAFVIFFATVLISFTLELLAGCSLIVTTGLCGVAVFILASQARLFRFLQGLSRDQSSRFLHPIILIAIVMWSAVFMTLATNFFAAEFDWFLRGHYSWLSLMFLVGSVWGVFDLFHWHIGLSREMEEFGVGAVPLGLFNVKTKDEWGKGFIAAQGNEDRKPTFPERSFDSQMDSFLTQLGSGKPTTSIELWRYGSRELQAQVMTRLISILWFVVILPVAIVMGPGPQTRGIVSFALMQAFIFIFVPRAIVTLGRKAFQEMELLRPWCRRDWINVWFRWVGSKVIPILLIAIAISYFLLWFEESEIWSPIGACVAAIIAPGIIGIAFGVGMFTLTLRSLIPSAVGYVICIGIAASSISAAVLFADDDLGLNKPSILIPAIIGIYILAYGGLRLAKWRWQNWEVGSVT